jgi:hypothetical protein
MRRRWQLNQDGIWVRTALEQETRIEQAERVKKQKTDRKDAQFLLRLMREKQLSANLGTESGELGSATTGVEPASVGAVAHADHESAAGASREGLSLVELLFVVIQSCFRQQNSNLVLHLHHLTHQQVALTQRTPAPEKCGRSHVALRQKVTPQVVAKLIRIDGLDLLFRCRNRSQHQRMRHFDPQLR